jgi:hypothetical protein
MNTEPNGRICRGACAVSRSRWTLTCTSWMSVRDRVAGIPVRCFVFHTDYRSNYGVLEDRPAEGPRPIGEPVSGRIPNSGVDLAESAAHAQDVRRQKRTFLGWLRWHPSRREVYGVPALQEEKPNVGDLVGVGHHVLDAGVVLQVGRHLDQPSNPHLVPDRPDRGTEPAAPT